jgi:hypothetical protein
MPLEAASDGQRQIPHPESDSSSRRTKPGIGDAAPIPPDDVDPATAVCQHSLLSDFDSIRREIDPTTSPQDAAALALLVPQTSAGEVERAMRTMSRLLGEASARWPADQELAWLHAMHCETHSGCDYDRALAHLVNIDADNAAVWVQVAGHARRRGDHAAESAALSRAANAPFHDARSGLVYMRVRPKLTGLSVRPDCLVRLESEIGTQLNAEQMRDMIASSADSAFGTPSYEGVAGCNPDLAPLPDQRRRDCEILLRRIADGDSLLEQTLGVGMLLRLNVRFFDQVALRERYRQLLWLQNAIPDAASSLQFISRAWVEGEVNFLRGVAIREGRWPPPEGWLPDSPAQRALILGQRDPDS